MSEEKENKINRMGSLISNLVEQDKAFHNYITQALKLFGKSEIAEKILDEIRYTCADFAISLDGKEELDEEDKKFREKIKGILGRGKCVVPNLNEEIDENWINKLYESWSEATSTLLCENILIKLTLVKTLRD